MSCFLNCQKNGQDSSYLIEAMMIAPLLGQVAGKSFLKNILKNPVLKPAKNWFEKLWPYQKIGMSLPFVMDGFHRLYRIGNHALHNQPNQHLDNDFFALGSDVLGVLMAYENDHPMVLAVSRILDLCDGALRVYQISEEGLDVSNGYWLGNTLLRAGLKHSLLQRPPRVSIDPLHWEYRGAGFEAKLSGGGRSSVSPYNIQGVYHSSTVEIPEATLRVRGPRSVAVNRKKPDGEWQSLTLRDGFSPAHNPDGSSQLTLHGRIEYQTWAKKNPRDKEPVMISSEPYQEGRLVAVNHAHFSEGFLSASTGRQGKVLLLKDNGEEVHFSGDFLLEVGRHPNTGSYTRLIKRES